VVLYSVAILAMPIVGERLPARIQKCIDTIDSPYYDPGMAMGHRKDRARTPALWMTISRTRRLIDLETHRAVFTWILQVLATANLVRGRPSGSMRPR
jgi:hypothetical protein